MTTRRARVAKLSKPVTQRGQRLWWEYSVPLAHGTLVGWRETQPQALARCRDLINEKRLKGWT